MKIKVNHNPCSPQLHCFCCCLFVFSDGGLVLFPRLESCDLSSLQFLPSGSSDSLVSASWVAGIPAIRHHTKLIFVFLVETGFHHVCQAGFKLLTSGDLSELTSQRAGITCVSHHAWPTPFNRGEKHREVK